MHFLSDNTSAVHPAIMNAIIEVNHGNATSYGRDEWSAKAHHRFSEIFEKEVIVYFTSTGSAANALALSSMTPGHGLIFAHEEAHIQTDEANAPELMTGGAKISLIRGHQGKMHREPLMEKIEQVLSLRPHMGMPAALSLSQSTESGTIYTPEEIRALTEVARRYHLPVHMDGARFANALVSLGCSAAELTWQAGVDVLCLGGTKNGAMMAEAVVFFNKDLVKTFDYHHKRAGQLMSKMRYIAAQFLAYLNDDVWLRNALHANEMTSYLEEVLIRYEGVELLHPVETNEIFVRLPKELATHLVGQGCHFYEWGPPAHHTYRFVTSWMTSESEIEKFRKIVSEFAKMS